MEIAHCSLAIVHCLFDWRLEPTHREGHRRCLLSLRSGHAAHRTVGSENLLMPRLFVLKEFDMMVVIVRTPFVRLNDTMNGQIDTQDKEQSGTDMAEPFLESLHVA